MSSWLAVSEANPGVNPPTRVRLLCKHWREARVGQIYAYSTFELPSINAAISPFALSAAPISLSSLQHVAFPLSDKGMCGF